MDSLCETDQLRYLRILAGDATAGTWRGTASRLEAAGLLLPTGEINPKAGKAIAKAAPSTIPFDEIADLYNRILPDLPPCKKLTPSLRDDIQARWRADPERRDLSWWRAYFSQVAASPFLMGLKKDWRASLKWLLGKQNMDKVLSGNYGASQASGMLTSKGREAMLAMMAAAEAPSPPEWPEYERVS